MYPWSTISQKCSHSKGFHPFPATNISAALILQKPLHKGFWVHTYFFFMHAISCIVRQCHKHIKTGLLCLHPLQLSCIDAPKAEPSTHSHAPLTFPQPFHMPWYSPLTCHPLHTTSLQFALFNPHLTPSCMLRPSLYFLLIFSLFLVPSTSDM